MKLASDTDPFKIKEMRGKKELQDQEIIALISAGMANKQIAQELATTELSIKDKVHKLLRKYNCRNRTELAMKFANVA